MGVIVEDRPFVEEDDFAALRRTQQDVVSRRQALRFFTASQVRHRLESGRWRALQRGMYLTRQGPVGEPQRQWVALLGAGYDRDQRVCLGGLSALKVWGLRRVDCNAIHAAPPSIAPDAHLGRRRRDSPSHRPLSPAEPWPTPRSGLVATRRRD